MLASEDTAPSGRRRTTWRGLLSAALFFVAGTLWLIFLLWPPLVLLYLLTCGWALVRALRSASERAKRGWLLVVGICAALLVGEVVGLVMGAPLGWSPLFEYQADLGYVPAGDSIDKQRRRGGVRATPSSNRNSRCKVLLAGDSFAFGDGLADDETVAEALARRLPQAGVYNMGFSGYGAHQMLRMLELGWTEAVLGAAPDHVVYLAIPHHVERARGVTPWDLNGPSYAVHKDGSVSLVGPFHSRPTARFLGQLERSFAGALLVDRLVLKARIDDDHRQYLGIVNAARRHVEAAGGSFRVLHWPTYRTDKRNLTGELRAAGLTVYDAQDFVPDLGEAFERYHLADGHPNALATSLVGRALAEAMLREQGGTLCGAAAPP